MAGTVFPRRGKKGITWYVSYMFNGKQIRHRVKGATTRADAENVLATIQADILRGEYKIQTKKERIRFKKFVEQYLAYKRENNKLKTYKRDITSLNHILPFFSDMMLTDINPWLIEKYKMQRKEEIKAMPRNKGKADKEISFASINRELACLRHIFNKAIEWGYLKENPLARKVKFFRENNNKVRFFSLKEIDSLKDACHSYLRPVIETALNTGMRESEILNLKCSDVDLDLGLIHIEDTKNRERAEVPINNQLKEVLSKILSNSRGKNGYVFLNSRGRPYRSIRTAYLTALKKAGIKNANFHTLRHTFASHLVMAGVDLTTVKELMRHKSIEMTLRYAHLAPDHKKKAVEKLGEVFSTNSAQIEKLEIAEAG